MKSGRQPLPVLVSCLFLGHASIPCWEATLARTEQLQTDIALFLFP